MDQKPAEPGLLHVLGSNRLLTLIGEDCDATLLEEVSLKQKDLIFRPHSPITHVHFPLSGVISVVANLHAGLAIEVGTVGNEGFAGLPLLHGTDQSVHEAFVQMPGKFLRMPAAAFQAQVDRNPSFRHVMHRFAQAFYTFVSQSTACGHFHPIPQRLARFVLLAHDRAGSDTVELTQEFLAIMLGVQRPGVTLAALALQEAGLIRYRHGIIDVLSRAGLEDASCECYAVVRKEYERLLC